VAAAHVLLGMAFVAGNLWFAASRSTIPLELSGVVANKARLVEKSPPKDDVCLIVLHDGARVQVDAPVFEALTTGDRIDKQRWSRTLTVSGREVPLEWSADFRGLLWTMSGATALGAALLAVVLWGRSGAAAAKQE
jgi:hypothetical protein